jgi:hypothetical protein
MEIILKLFEAFGFVNIATPDRLIFQKDNVSIHINESEVSLTENESVLRVPFTHLNAIAFLAYTLTSKNNRVKLIGLENTEKFLEEITSEINRVTAKEYNDNLLEVFIQYQLMNRHNSQ